MNYLKEHLISRIQFILADKMEKIESPHIIYLDEMIGGLNRISKYYPYDVNNLPISWTEIDGKSLLYIKEALEENKFHIYKVVENQRMKVRLKSGY